MRDKHPDLWKELGHIHMAADEVPWKVAGVGGVNMKSEMKGGEKNLKMEFWESMRQATKRVNKTGNTKMWMQSAEQFLEVLENVKVVDNRFSVGAVAEFKKLADRGEGLVRTVLDRDAGRLWLTCPALHAKFGREHFNYANDKEEWENCDEEDRPQYWRVHQKEDEILKEWRNAYQRVNKSKCAGRWREWDPGGGMMKARWQYKKKNVLKIRAIFNGKKDPAVKEMEVAAKCVGLFKRTVGTNDFSMNSGLDLGEWLEKAEEDLSDVFGDRTELRVLSTDFKNFFPSNKKSAMVGVVQKAVGMIFEGSTSPGMKMPSNRWITIPKGKKDKAMWGKRSLVGAQ
jgi:hypothetical protein